MYQFTPTHIKAMSFYTHLYPHLVHLVMRNVKKAGVDMQQIKAELTDINSPLTLINLNKNLETKMWEISQGAHKVCLKPNSKV